MEIQPTFVASMPYVIEFLIFCFHWQHSCSSLSRTLPLSTCMAVTIPFMEANPLRCQVPSPNTPTSADSASPHNDIAALDGLSSATHFADSFCLLIMFL